MISFTLSAAGSQLGIIFKLTFLSLGLERDVLDTE